MQRVEKLSIIEEILSIIHMVKINIIISINTKMSIKILKPNNRIIIKESFANLPYVIALGGPRPRIIHLKISSIFDVYMGSLQYKKFENIGLPGDGVWSIESLCS